MHPGAGPSDRFGASPHWATQTTNRTGHFAPCIAYCFSGRACRRRSGQCAPSWQPVTNCPESARDRQTSRPGPDAHHSAFPSLRPPAQPGDSEYGKRDWAPPPWTGSETGCSGSRARGSPATPVRSSRSTSRAPSGEAWPN